MSGMKCVSNQVLLLYNNYKVESANLFLQTLSLIQ